MLIWLRIDGLIVGSAVCDDDNLGGEGESIFTMADSNDGEAGIETERIENLEYGASVRGVEIAGGFVGEDNLGTEKEGTSNAGALGLTTRDDGRAMGEDVSDTEHIGELVGAGVALRWFETGEDAREGDIL